MNALTKIKHRLKQRFENISVRGEGSASFIYVTNHGRAVEISAHKNGWWLEFWDKTDNENDAPIKEKTVASPEQAINDVIKWLH